MSLKVFFSRRWWWTTLLVLAAMAVMARLGVWQLDRRQQRLAANADVVAKLAQSPASLNEAAEAAVWPFPEERSAIRNLRASASGQFDFAQQVILLEQAYEGTPGVHLVAPLRLTGSDQAVLVDRGFVPLESIDRALTDFNDQVDEVTVTGLLLPSQILFGRAARLAADQEAPSAPQQQVYRIDIDAIQRQVPYPLLPVYLQQEPSGDGSPTLPYAIEPEFDLSEGSHLSYALQWFSFALILGIVYVFLVRNRERAAAAQLDSHLAAEGD